jgi:hypothetical protein
MQPSRPSRRGLIIGTAILGALVLLAVAGAIAYVAGVFDEKPRFSAAPAACAPVDPGLHLLGAGFTTATTGNTCEVKAGDHVVMRISLKVAATPAEATRTLQQSEASEVTGLGDLAFRRGPLTVFRVSNLMVLCIVISTKDDFSDTGMTVAQVRIFQSDLADRLAAG